jgi:hypothetical protein
LKLTRYVKVAVLTGAALLTVGLAWAGLTIRNGNHQRVIATGVAAAGVVVLISGFILWWRRRHAAEPAPHIHDHSTTIWVTGHNGPQILVRRHGRPAAAATWPRGQTALPGEEQSDWGPPDAEDAVILAFDAHTRDANWERR